MNEKYTDLFSSMEIDAIGEILNISLGSSATAMSDMLDRRVNITTPNVRILSVDEFEFTSLEPAIGVEIVYVAGIEGSNIMLLRRSDVKKILEILMGVEIDDEQFVLDEISLSAVCEVMNQMMGASATALADFIGEPVNISTPVSFEVDNAQDFKHKYFDATEPMIVVGFNLDIENSVSSEFLTLMSIKLARRLIGSVTTLHDSSLSEVNVPTADIPNSEVANVAIPAETADTTSAPASDNHIMTPEEIAAAIAAMEQGQETQTAAAQPEVQVPQSEPMAAPTPSAPVMPNPVPAPTPVAAPVPTPTPVAPPPQPQRPMVQQQAPKIINAQPMYENFDADGNRLTKDQEANLDLIMRVPLQISVEIGRTKKLVKDILEFNHGTLVVLDKLAGEPVDLYVNGQCIAKGDVVVVDDSFGVKITEIIKKSDMLFKK